jgi:hypothetical protein
VYSGRGEFNLGPQASHPDILNGFRLSRQTAEQYFKTGHDSFLPYPYQFIIQKSSHLSTMYNLVENKPLNKPRIIYSITGHLKGSKVSFNKEVHFKHEISQINI